MTKANNQAGAWAIIYCKSTGRFLMGRRSNRVKKPGLWNFFGGRLNEGESSHAAVLRELCEETGFRAAPDQNVDFGGGACAGLVKLGFVDALRELHYFLMITDHEVAPVMNEEHDEFGWFEPCQIPEKVNRATGVALNIGLIEKVLESTGIDCGENEKAPKSGKGFSIPDAVAHNGAKTCQTKNAPIQQFVKYIRDWWNMP